MDLVAFQAHQQFHLHPHNHQVLTIHYRVVTMEAITLSLLKLGSNVN